MARSTEKELGKEGILDVSQGRSRALSKQQLRQLNVETCIEFLLQRFIEVHKPHVG